MIISIKQNFKISGKPPMNVEIKNTVHSNFPMPRYTVVYFLDNLITKETTI